MDISFSILSEHEKVSQELGLKYEALSKLIYPNTNQSYKSFTIPKKNGEQRLIHAPKIKLLKIQQKLAEKLNEIYQPRKSTHGFIKGCSIVTNAKQHINRKYVLNIDLKDFFTSIHFGRVRNLLMSKPFNYSQISATILAQICCHNGKLPQGAPTSPIISNIICWKLDAQLKELARKNSCTYTRYADDITFSFNVSKRKIPKSIVNINSNSEEIEVGATLNQIVIENGFQVNEAKVRLQGRNQRQEVTGVTVNRGPNLKRKFIRDTASMLHAWKKFGVVNAEKEYLEKYRVKTLTHWQDDTNKKDGSLFKNIVRGRINYLRMIKGPQDPVYRKLAYKLTELLGEPNDKFIRNLEQSATFVIEDFCAGYQGTAFLLKDVGVVTNQHCVKGMTKENWCLFHLHREHEDHIKRKCKFLYASEINDIAILQPSKDMAQIRCLEIGNDTNITVGDKVKIVGFPKYAPKSGLHITHAKITSKREFLGVDTWVVDRPVFHGNSGGPVLNSKNEVIGIVRSGAESSKSPEGIYGFIPISILSNLLETDDYLRAITPDDIC